MYCGTCRRAAVLGGRRICTPQPRFAKQTMATGKIAQLSTVAELDQLRDQYVVAAKPASKLVWSSAVASSACHLRRVHTVRFRHPPQFPHHETQLPEPNVSASTPDGPPARRGCRW